ncbi:unnamed protein product, partial [Oppiella nova]
MVDMKYILHTSIRYVSLYTTFYSAGLMLGTLTAAIFLAFMGVCTALTPLSPELWTLYTYAFFVGLGAGVWNGICNVWMIEIWGHRSAPLLQLLHCGFGVGNIISPLILKSHLIGEIHRNSSTGSQSIGDYTNETDVLVESSVDRRAGLIIPFQINAFIQILSPVALVVMFIWKRYEPQHYIQHADFKLATDDMPELKMFDREGFPRQRAILLFCVWLSVYLVSETTILSFGATYFQYCPLKLTAQESAQLLSTVAMAFTAGRGLSALLALRFKPQQMIGYHFAILIIATITLYVGQYNLTVLWVSTIMAGLGFSAMFPAMFAYLGQYLSITNPIGVFVERYSWVVLMFESIYVGTCLLLFVSFIGMTMTMYAPVMVDMKYILHTSIRYVSLYTTFLSAGYMTGTLTAIIFLAFMSIGSALTPLSPDLSALYTCAFLVGMGASVWNSMCNVWMIELWGHRSAPLLQLLHCGFGVGNIISPLILKSHLIGEIHSNSSTGSQSIGNYTNETEVWVESSVDRRAELIIPFQINAFIQLLFTDNTPAPKLFDRDGFPRKRAILLFCVWLSTYCVAEATILSFGATYFQYCPLKLTAQESAQLLSAVAIAFTIGRGLSVLTALRYSPKQMIGYHFVVLIIAAITLYVGQYNLSVLWVSTILTGLGLSAMCPAMFAYLEQYLSITNPIGAIAIFSSEGMTLTMFGPVMVDMKFILHTSIRYVSLYTTFLSAGYMLGTVFGYLYEYLNRQLVAIIFLALMSIGSALTPLSPDLWALYGCAFVIGMGASVWNCMCNVWMIEIWGNRSAPFLQLLHCGFGVGCIISPLILKSHLVGETHHTSSTGSQALGNYTNETEVSMESSIDRRTGLIIPFQINGFIQILSPVGLLAMFIWKRYVPPQPIARAKAATGDISEQKLFDREGSPRKWAIFIFCHSVPRLTAQESAQLLSTVATAFTVGRGLSVLMALRFKPQQMIGYHFAILIIAAITLYAGQYNLTVLWVSTIMAGLGLSAMCPAMFAYLEQYLSITNPIGVFVERYSWVVLMFESIYVGTCLLLFVSFIILVD